MVTQCNSAKVSRLRAQQLFAGVNDHTLAGTNVRFATFAPGDVISRQGDKQSPLVLVVSGLAHATRISEEGREISIEFARPGGACGESAILLGQPATASLVAVTDVLAGLVERAEANRLFSDTIVSKGLMQLMSNRLERLVDGQTVLTRPSAASRIYGTILGFVKGGACKDEPPQGLPNQAAIALAANVSRETVSRALTLLLERGALSKGGRRYHVTDTGLLESLAAAA